MENNSTLRTMAKVPARSVIRVDLSQWAVQLMGRWTGESPSTFHIITPFSTRYDSEGKFLNSLPDLHEPRFAMTCTTFISSNGEEVFHLDLIHFFLSPDRIIVYPCQPLNVCKRDTLVNFWVNISICSALGMPPHTYITVFQHVKKLQYWCGTASLT